MVVNSNPDSVQLREYRNWVEAEWGTVDSFEGIKDGVALPSPVLAFSHKELVGGLSFTYSTIPETEEIALWINTLLVAPKYRRNGIGSQLVQKAEYVIAKNGIKELYTYTTIPALYQKLGWKIYKETDEGNILKTGFV